MQFLVLFLLPLLILYSATEELSGLGVRSGWHSMSLQERYDAMRNAAQTRSILSIGISTFRLVGRKENSNKKRIKYKCQVFNLLTLSSKPFVVEPSALKFLAKHKFDFNRLITSGIPYWPYEPNNLKENALRTLWLEILGRGVPICLHNGLYDLIFIYQNFFSTLPESFNQFVVNIADWFDLGDSKMGFIDSKYLAEYKMNYNTSFLEYVFRKCQRENVIEETQSRLYVSVEFDYPIEQLNLTKCLEVVDCGLPERFYECVKEINRASINQESRLCSKFAAYEFCRNSNCNSSHDVDLLIDIEDQKQEKIRLRRKRRYDFIGGEQQRDSNNAADEKDCNGDAKYDARNGRGDSDDNDEKSTDCSDDVEDERKSQCSGSTGNEQAEGTKYLQNYRLTGCHRAGADSFMTGFAVAFMQRMSILRTSAFEPEFCNRVTLPAKMLPMNIQGSDYTKPSDDHVKLMDDVKRQRSRIAETLKV